MHGCPVHHLGKHLFCLSDRLPTISRLGGQGDWYLGMDGGTQGEGDGQVVASPGTLRQALCLDSWVSSDDPAWLSWFWDPLENPSE